MRLEVIKLKKQLIYFISGIVLVLFSAPLGRETLRIIYRNKNLTSSYHILLKSSINAYVLAGIMLFVLGLVKYYVENSSKH